MQNHYVESFFKLQHPIIEARLLENNLFFVDTQSIVYIFDSKFILLSKMRLDKNSTNKHIFSNEFNIFNSNISVPIQHNLISAKYGQDNKIKPIFKSDIHQSNIVFTRHSKDAKFLLSASVDGKVFIHDLEAKTTRYSYKNRPDHCSFGLFSHKNRFIFVGYFNRINTLLNLHNDTLIEFDTPNAIEIALFFDDDRKLFLADREGYSIIYDCIKNEIISKKVLFTHWPSSATLSQNKKNIVIGTRADKLYIIDPFKNELINSMNFEDSAVGKVDIKDGKLLIGFTNGNISLIDLNYKKQQFLHHVNLKEYDKAKEILDTNCFLYLDDAIESFKDGFEEVLTKAKEFITKKRPDEAMKIVEPFIWFEEFKKKTDTLFMQQDHIALFIEAVEKSDIHSAYFLAKKYPIVESLHYYNLLENKWEKLYAEARNVLEQDPLRGMHKVKNILSEYEKVPQKNELIKFLLNNKVMLFKADEAIKKQDFKTYFKLVEEFDFLKGTRLYKKIENLAISIKNRSSALYASKQYREAQESYRGILDFPQYKQFALSEIEKIDHILRFQFAVEKGNKKLIYSFASRHSFLSFTPEFEKFNERFDKTISSASKVAKQGNVEKARYILHKYLGIKELEKKIDNCLKIGYLKQFENIDANSKALDLFLKRYNFLFGIDNLLEASMIKKSLSKLYEEFCKNPSTLEVKRYPDFLHL
ncbi:MAG: WD40 repeat domain-containing protein [Sulfurimonas sp.]|nr:WD40 repeat domain-containing protein [Sulfurimonas sp.]